MKVGNDLFDAKEDPENAHITLEEYENELRKQGMYSGDKSLADMTTAEMVDSLVSTTTVDLARDTTLFEAQMVALAFRVGRLEGQSGNAIVIYIALKDTPPAFISSSLIAYNLYLHTTRQQ